MIGMIFFPLFSREDHDSMRESSSQDDLDDEEYGKPKTSLKKRKMKKMLKKKRKRKLGRKPSAVLKEEFSDLPEFERPNGGWVQEYHFQCRMCTNQLDDDGEGNKEPSSIVGFEASVDHMTEKHSSLVSPDKQFQVSFKLSQCLVYSKNLSPGSNIFYVY